jgi:hypothetical protein
MKPTYLADYNSTFFALDHGVNQKKVMLEEDGAFWRRYEDSVCCI